MMSLLKDVIGYGVHADRPAAGSQGRLYYETDTNTIFRDNGTTWDMLSFATPAMVLLADVYLDSAPAANITFSGLSGAYTSLLVRGWLRSTDAAYGTFTQVRFNGDSGANYDRNLAYFFQGSVGDGATLGETYFFVGDTCAGGAPAGDFSAVELWLPGYSNTHINKALRSYVALQGEYTTGHIGHEWSEGFWNSTAAITDLEFFPTAGDWAQYSRLSVYGLL